MSARPGPLGAAVLAAALALASAADASAPPGAGRASSAPAVPSIPAARAAGGAPRVEAMIVGVGDSQLMSPRALTARAATVHVRGHACTVAAGTPLAVLLAARQSGGPGFAVRDYGRCGSRSADSGQLFVYSVGGQTNRGQSGWEYKVDGVSGATGAADQSGPHGDGRRLRPGQRVLWFWCESGPRGCQRTLEVSAQSTSVARGGMLSVSVTGYDNEGRGAPVAGAIVTLGADFASTGSSGRASLIAPASPGRYALSAARGGLVQSFPEQIAVR